MVYWGRQTSQEVIKTVGVVPALRELQCEPRGGDTWSHCLERDVRGRGLFKRRWNLG